ncbi:hypothetical protein BQ8794_240040 [Mesorhizobium prunaredense]|uniref:Uncharacterized protein n=2 Tax=Mesorhizobium TaxID=68287 RepID=A0A1R3V7I5_9HYPH|nr:conserved hypothetical protein [Mesorhizobium ventifaucium]SIT55833.1 hypothetical protein BQ8794_240040 [Mesorhizobium prunaredense]
MAWFDVRWIRNGLETRDSLHRGERLAIVRSFEQLRGASHRLATLVSRRALRKTFELSAAAGRQRKFALASHPPTRCPASKIDSSYG